MTSIVLLFVLVLMVLALIISIMDAKAARDEAESLQREADIWMSHAMYAADQRDTAVELARGVLMPQSKIGLGPGHKVGEC